jgi:membrane protein DedA with SNARE-associated domain/rhodanese-related sulfurtransferase
VTTSLELTYGGMFLAVFAQQLCLPIPSVAFLMAAGALSAGGHMHAGIILGLAVLGCLAGDGIWFWVGRRWGSKALRLLCRFASDPRSCSRNAQEQFRRYGLPVLCVAKFLPGLDLLMPPLGGAQGVPAAAFLALDAAGSFLWAGAYVGLGYVFSKELNIAIRWVENFGTAAGIGIGVPFALYAGWRGLVLVRMIRHLRLRRISPPLLARKLKSDRKVAVLDLSNFEEEAEGESLERIPGALSVDPSILRKSPHITIPDDVKIILYCSSGSDVVSARAAVGLKRIGINKVWVLEGGLKAWREHGLPVSQSPETPEIVAERYGVKLPSPPSSYGRYGPAARWLRLARRSRGKDFPLRAACRRHRVGSLQERSIK